MIATHGDSYHIGGLLDVLEAIPVAEAWLDGNVNDSGEGCTAHPGKTTLDREGELDVDRLQSNPGDASGPRCVR